MKTRLLWFFLGFLACVFVFAAFAYRRNRSFDYIEFVPSDARDMMTEALPWIRSAHMERVGGFLVVTPLDKNIGDALIDPIAKPHFPMIMMHDSRSSGLPSSVQIVDGKMRNITLTSKNDIGVWDSFAFGTGIDSNSVSFVDTNMDGVFDVRLGPR